MVRTVKSHIHDELIVMVGILRELLRGHSALEGHYRAKGILAIGGADLLI